MSIKYTGSKKWLTRVLRPIDEVYEPFAGSAVVSFQRSSQCHLNDQLTPLIEMYRELQKDKHGFAYKVQAEINAIKASGNPKAAFYDARGRFNATNMTDPVLFCVILYLGFNGLYRVSRNGCNVPWGGNNRHFNPAGILDIPVEKIASLSNGSWDTAPVPSEDCTIYADPPYATTFTGYTANGWRQADNAALFTWLSDKPNPVLISCLRTDDNEKLLTELGFDYVTMSKKFSNGAKSVVKGEILAFNDSGQSFIKFREVRK